MGGAIHVDSLSDSNCFNISYSYFSMNVALMGAILNLNLYSGPTCFVMQGNLFISNRGYDFKNHIGSGSVFKILMVGPYIGPIFSMKNKYLDNLSEINGKIKTK